MSDETKFERDTYESIDQVLEAFAARHGEKVGEIARAIWKVTQHHTGIMTIIIGDLDKDTRSAIEDSWAITLTMLLHLMPLEVAKDFGPLLKSITRRYADMMLRNDG